MGIWNLELFVFRQKQWGYRTLNCLYSGGTSGDMEPGIVCIQAEPVGIWNLELFVFRRNQWGYGTLNCLYSGGTSGDMEP